MPRSSLRVQPVVGLLCGVFLLVVVIQFGVVPAIQRQAGFEYRSLTNTLACLDRSNRVLSMAVPWTSERAVASLAVLSNTLSKLKTAYEYWAGLFVVPEPVRSRLNQPFHLLSYELEVQQAAARLMQLAKANGVSIGDEATGGLPHFTDFTDEASGPELLWIRLYLTERLIERVIQAKCREIRAIRQLPASKGRYLGGLSELVAFPFYLQLVGDYDSVLRFIDLLIGTPQPVNQTNTVLNGPPFFIDRMLLQKASREEPELVRAELVVRSFVVNSR